MKRTIAILLMIAALCAAVSCTSAKTSRNDIDCEALNVNAEKKIALTDGLDLISKGAISLTVQPYISEAVEAANDYVIRFTGGSSFDEIGILRYDDADAAEKNAAVVKDYLKSLQEDELYRSYFPSEEYKLDEWEVKTFGNYVVYAVLSAENRAAYLGEVEQLLVKV